MIFRKEPCVYTSFLKRMSISFSFGLYASSKSPPLKSRQGLQKSTCAAFKAIEEANTRDTEDRGQQLKNINKLRKVVQAPYVLDFCAV